MERQGVIDCIRRINIWFRRYRHRLHESTIAERQRLMYVVGIILRNRAIPVKLILDRKSEIIVSNIFRMLALSVITSHIVHEGNTDEGTGGSFRTNKVSGGGTKR